MRMKKSRVAILAVALGASAAGLLTSPAHATRPSPDGTSPSASSKWDGGWVYQGNDFAFFDFKDHKVIVCDKEKDKHPVYAYLRHRNDMVATYLYDNTSGCTSHYIEGTSAYKYVTVCESVWGPDWCHSPVYLR